MRKVTRLSGRAVCDHPAVTLPIRFVARALAVGVAGWVVFASAAAAAAGPLTPGAARYEPGDEAVLTAVVAPPPEGWETGLPYSAYFRPAGPPTGPAVRIGPLPVEEVAGPAGPTLSVALVFRIPPDAEPGRYEVAVCDVSCTTGLGDVTVSEPLHVGVDPPRAGPPATPVPVPPGGGRPVALSTAPVPAEVASPGRARTPAAAAAPGKVTVEPEGNLWFVLAGTLFALGCSAAAIAVLRGPAAGGSCSRGVLKEPVQAPGSEAADEKISALGHPALGGGLVGLGPGVALQEDVASQDPAVVVVEGVLQPAEGVDEGLGPGHGQRAGPPRPLAFGLPEGAQRRPQDVAYEVDGDEGVLVTGGVTVEYQGDGPVGDP